jgi:hypothetical protein
MYIANLQITEMRCISKYSLCPTFSILAVRPVAIAWVAVIEGVTYFLSLPK